MISFSDFAPIAELDLDPIKVKLMRQDDGKGWTREQADTVEVEYRRFLYLMKMFPHEPTAPLVDVDTFWHYHILDTMKYAADCDEVFGYFLHHFPYVGLRGKKDEEALAQMGLRMAVLYEETFGESYARPIADRSPRLRAETKPAYCTRVAAQPAYCTRVAAQPAYCTRVAQEPVYCTRVEAQPAYCTRVDAFEDGDSKGADERTRAVPFVGRLRTDRPTLARV
ncbi:MAG: hypothetical protein M3R60_14805 [Pseudomonadota bacterium]|nr:hypothetical protein [Pseudomonadota bacterium]